MMKRLLAGVVAAIGCISANAVVVQIDVTGTVTNYYNYQAVNNDPSKVGTSITLSYLFDLSVSPVNYFNGGTYEQNTQSSTAGCYSVGPTNCMSSGPGPSMLQSVTGSVNGVSYGMLTGATYPMGTTSQITKTTTIFDGEYLDIYANQGQSLYKDAQGFAQIGTRNRVWGFSAGDASILDTWLGVLTDMSDLPDFSEISGKSLSMYLTEINRSCDVFGIVGGSERCISESFSAGSFQATGIVTGFTVTVLDANDVPEPGTLALVGVGLIGLVAGAKKRKQVH